MESKSLKKEKARGHLLDIKIAKMIVSIFYDTFPCDF